MTVNTNQNRSKRRPKGWRKHVRLLKQAARREGIPFRRSGYVRTPEISDPAVAKSLAESTKAKGTQ